MSLGCELQRDIWLLIFMTNSFQRNTLDFERRKNFRTDGRLRTVHLGVSDYYRFLQNSLQIITNSSR